MSKKPPQAYSDLQTFSRSISTYNSILTLLHWDQETYMPSGGITPRSEQIAQLSEYIHHLKGSRKFRQLLDKLIHVSSGNIKVKGLSRLQQISLSEWWKEYLRVTKLPPAFVRNFSQITSEATQIWATAKKENNFKLFAPFLDKIVKLCREKADLCGFEDHPYDALLENFEPCMTSAKVSTIFTHLKKELVSLLNQIQGKRQINDRFLHGAFDENKQMELGRALLAKLPVEENYTRLDISSHPFSLALHPHDSRITTRIAPDGFMSNLFSILHETGHSFYEMGLPVDTWGTPLSEYVSLSIHESQSRWWETLIGRSLPFWQHHYPLVQKTFLKKVSLDRFYHAINKVTPSLIRVEADEVTYCLHVILRFELEKDLITGKLSVSDLPDAWNAKMKEMLGVTPPDDRQGCLQDIHWSMGAFGYFPTYALGNLFAAHFFSTFAKQHPDWEKKVSQGDLSFIRQWLKENIHSKGRQYDAEGLAKHVTGKPFSASAYCHYLKKKYSEIYNL